mmetsp:Transcript_26381/g.44048  ORF Transcript_26381/g.44048 Transcript_26381/m.44048 type:complete len:80 (-) Transcript_26381:116-355(-)
MLLLYQVGQEGNDSRKLMTATEMHNELKKMIDPVDTGLMFCHFKRGNFAVAKTAKGYKIGLVVKFVRRRGASAMACYHT